MIIEVTIDGRGAVRIETEYTGTPKQIRSLITHAAATINCASPSKANQPIGFSAGTSLTTEVE